MNKNKLLPTTKVALVYDWLDTNYGGAEKVLQLLHQIFPKATLFTSYVDYQQVKWHQQFEKIETSFIQKFPASIKKKKALLALFMPYAFETFNFNSYDLIISVSSFAAKGIITNPKQLHLCYLLTPTRFLYSHSNTYLSPFKKIISQPLIHYLKKWDQVAIRRPDIIIAISQLVAKRCQKYYQKKVDKVIYPTITPNITPSHQIKHNYFLVISRLVKYKKIDLVIKACGQLNQPLKIIGHGPEYNSLKKLINENRWQGKIELLGNLNEAQTYQHLSSATALIAPGLEDFGINLIEANQYQTLVIAHPKSGALELLDPSMFIEIKNHNLTGLIDAIKQVETYEINNIKKQKSNTETFLHEFSEYISHLYCTIQ